MTAVPQNFPFGQVPALSQPPVTYDIVMAKNYPRVSFVPTETGGIYQELVEVNGDLWFVTNATWDVNKLGFYQESGTLVNCNSSQNAYAWVQRGLAGDAIRMYAAATNSHTVAVTWVPVFDAAPVGTIVSPLPLTQNGQAAFAVNVAFNGSNSTVLSAFQVNVTNVASASLSPLAQYSVNGVPVWSVDTTGTLQIGKINPSQLSPPVYMTLKNGTGIAPIGPPPSATIGLAHDDYVDLPNAQTIKGIKRIDSPTPLKFGGGWGNIVGGPDDALYMCSGCEILNFPPTAANSTLAQSPNAMILAGKQEGQNQMLTLYINTSLTPGTTYMPTAVAWFSNAANFNTIGDINVGGALSVTGGVTITGPLTITGTTTLDGALVLSATTVQSLRNYFEGEMNGGYGYSANNNAGLAIGYDSANNAIVLDTTRLAYIGKDNSEGIHSSDGTVSITKHMNTGTVGTPTGDQNIDLSVQTTVGKALPVYDYAGSAKLSQPQIIIGSQTGATTGTNGPNGTSSIDFTFNFQVPFTNKYDLAVSVSGGWLIANVNGKSLSQCKVSVGFLTGGPGTVSCDIVAVGS